MVPSDAEIAVALSGGLDSSILLGHLARQDRPVHPLYVRTGLRWQAEELQAIARFLEALADSAADPSARRRLQPLTVFDLPCHDLYGQHWSTGGEGVPDAQSADEAVYLPGRNALLLLKPALWCQMRGIGQLALGVLGSNPFADATDSFFAALDSLLAASLPKNQSAPVRVVRPFGGMTKREVMRLGRRLPLELTFSCIAPVDGRHCGACNKCGERQRAFAAAGLPDPTDYAQGADPATTRR